MLLEAYFTSEELHICLCTVSILDAHITQHVPAITLVHYFRSFKILGGFAFVATRWLSASQRHCDS